jgi:SNF2 family DNA or RNA helicase
LRLVLGILQRELCSSPQAVAGTLAKLMIDPSRDEWNRKRLAGFKDLADLIPVSRKTQALCELLARFPEDQMLVFTEFRATLEHLREHLSALGHEVVCFHGGLSALEKEAAVERFRAGARVLLSTESGAEGRNLQFCHTLVNFDLPWNPMRIEQRIGRLHRLGQTRAVKVFNLSLNGTIEAHMVELLAHKIRLFELVVGELDLILGDIETKRSFEDLLQEAWRSAKDDKALESAFEKLGDKVLEAREGYAKTHQANDRLGLLLEGFVS